MRITSRQLSQAGWLPFWEGFCYRCSSKQYWWNLAIMVIALTGLGVFFVLVPASHCTSEIPDRLAETGRSWVSFDNTNRTRPTSHKYRLPLRCSNRGVDYLGNQDLRKILELDFGLFCSYVPTPGVLDWIRSCLGVWSRPNKAVCSGSREYVSFLLLNGCF